MQHKRERLARLSGRLGILTLLERLAASRPGLVAFTYHRIAGPGDDPYYDPVISATPGGFAEQVEAIARRMRVLTLEEAIARIEAGGPWRGTSALVTFDDGYRDNFEVAAPILSDLGIPAAFFLPSAFLESPRLPWWDAVAFILKRAPSGRLVLPRGPDGDGTTAPPLEIDLAAGPRSEAIRTVIAAFLDESIRDGDWFLGMMAERAGVAMDREAMGRALFADWELVRRATGAGVGLSVVRTGTLTGSWPPSIPTNSAASWPSRVGSSASGSAARSTRWPIPTDGRGPSPIGRSHSPPRSAIAWRSSRSRGSIGRGRLTRWPSAGSTSAPATRPSCSAPSGALRDDRAIVPLIAPGRVDEANFISDTPRLQAGQV